MYKIYVLIYILQYNASFLKDEIFEIFLDYLQEIIVHTFEEITEASHHPLRYTTYLSNSVIETRFTSENCLFNTTFLTNILLYTFIAEIQ